VALRQRERWADAVAETQELRADGDQIPPYVREAEADSLLALRRPGEARFGYEAVLSADPELREAHFGRFFALVEEDNFRAAFAEIDALAASESPGLRLPEQRVTRDHAGVFGVPPETIERWRQSEIVVVHFDAANRLENVTAKAPSLP
jgi:hypothetical protein